MVSVSPHRRKSAPVLSGAAFPRKSQLAQKQEERETLLQKIAKGRQVLSAAQFTDESSIISYRDSARASYQEYENAKAASEKKGALVLSVLFLLFAVLAGLGIGFPGTLARFAAELLPGAAHAVDHSAYLTLCAMMAVMFASACSFIELSERSSTWLNRINSSIRASKATMASAEMAESHRWREKVS